MARTAAAPPSWTIGRRVAVRGHTWTVEGCERGTDCLAVRLRSDAGRQSRPDCTLLTPFDRLQPLDPPAAPRVMRARKALHELRRLEAEAVPAFGLRAAAAAGVRLIPYQLEPALAVLRGEGARVLIADSVGLGKTVEAGLLLLELRERTEGFRALVLVPAGLKEQWLHELRARLGIDGTRADASWLTSICQGSPAGVNPWALPGIYVTSHDFVKRAEVLAPLEDVTWDLCVLDEAHRATSGSDRRAAADAIARRSRHVVLLTATPHPDAPDEFEALCRIGRTDDGEDPILLFRRTRADTGHPGSRRTAILPVSPTPQERRMHELLDRYTRSVWRESAARDDDLARLVSMVLRKRALSSAASLFRSVRRRIELLAARPAAPIQLPLPLADEDPLEDGEPDATLAAPGLNDARREHRWLCAIAEAAHHAAREESKTRVLLRLLRRVREPLIVFTEYRDTLARLHRAVAATGRPVVVLHGGMSPPERARVQRLFNAHPLALLATDAAAEGLNLHGRCRVVIHYELPWSAARLEQRAGRVDRFGQQKRVHEIALVAADTSERVVLAPLLARSAKARRAGTDVAPFVRSLTESRVATLVMDGRPGAASPEEEQNVPFDRRLFVRMDLRRDAEAEARRLEARRNKPGRPQGCGRERTRGVLVADIRPRRSTLQHGWVLVYRLALSSRDGRPVALEYPVLAFQSATPMPGRHPSRALRGLAERLLGTLPDEAPGRLRDAVVATVHSAAPIHARTQRVGRTREEAIFRLRRSTARRLVQAGLFDRRALKEMSSREIRSQQLVEEQERRLHGGGAGSPLSVDLTLAAILRIGVPRGPK